MRPVASPVGPTGSFPLHAYVLLYAGLLECGASAPLALDPKRASYVHLVRGELEVNGQHLATGDAALIDGENQLALRAGRNAEVLVFDLSA